MNDQQLGEVVGSVLRDLYPEEVGAARQIRPAEPWVPSPRPSRSRTALGVISAALVIAAVAGLIVTLVNRDRPHAPSAASAGRASGSAPPSATAAPELVLPKVVDDRLTRPYSLKAGRLQLTPAPASANPGLTVGAARTRGRQHGWIDTSAHSSVFLAVLTSYARPTDVDPATGELRPNMDKRLVWVLFQNNVHQPMYGPSPHARYALGVRFNALDAHTGMNIEGDYLTNLTDNPAVTTAPTR